MPAGEQADEHALEHLVLAGDHPLDLDERLLEQLAGGGVGRSRALRIGHCSSLETGVGGLAAGIGKVDTQPTVRVQGQLSSATRPLWMDSLANGF